MTVTYGWNRRLFVSIEATFNYLPLFAADDAVKFIESDFGGVQAGEKRFIQDITGTRSPALGLVPDTKKLPTQASFNRTFRPGTTTTDDCHEVRTNAFGTLSGSAYTIKANPTDSIALMLVDADGTFAEYLSGTIVTQWGLTGGAGEAMESYQLIAARRGSFAATILGAALSDGVGTTVVLAAPEKVTNAYGATILIESEQIQLSNDPADWVLIAGTSWTIANCTRAVNSSSGVAHADATAVTPAAPTETTAKSPIGESDNSATWNGVTYGLLEFEVTFETGRKHREHEFDSEFVQGILAGRVRVTGRGRFYMDSGTDQELMGHSEQETEAALSLVLGSTAGNIGTVAFAKAQISEAKAADNGPDDPLIVDFELMAYGSSGNDDITLTNS